MLYKIEYNDGDVQRIGYINLEHRQRQALRDFFLTLPEKVNITLVACKEEE